VEAVQALNLTNIDIEDARGFTPLVLAAYNGIRANHIQRLCPAILHPVRALWTLICGWFCIAEN
jgi:hypothetical protein